MTTKYIIYAFRFEEGTVIALIEKLERLRDDIKKVTENDESADLQNKVIVNLWYQLNYEAVILQLHDTRKALAADFGTLETNIRKRANQRTLSERNRNQVSE